VGPVTEQVVKSNDPHGGQGLVWVRDMARVWVKHRIAEVRLLCYKWLSPFLNPLNVELNPICHLLALLGAHHILHVSRIRVKLV